jgi:hypothetical protein
LLSLDSEPLAGNELVLLLIVLIVVGLSIEYAIVIFLFECPLILDEILLGLLIFKELIDLSINLNTEKFELLVSAQASSS